MLSLKNINFYYGKNKILDDVSFNVDKGEIIAVLGSSGSGKSTLLNIICGLETVSSGSIFLNGKDITNLECERRNIGLVFQDYALFPHLTVEKNVGFALKNSKDPIIYSMLDLVKMKSFKKRYPYELSGGEKQRVAIARSLAAKPSILLLDEPFSNLDANLKEEVRKDIKEILKKSNTTAVIVTHDIEDAYDLADRIIYIKGGKVDKIVDNNR